MVSFPRCDNVSLLATSPEKKKNPLHRLYAQGHDYHISVDTIMIFIPNSRGAPHTYFAPVRGPSYPHSHFTGETCKAKRD